MRLLDPFRLLAAVGFLFVFALPNVAVVQDASAPLRSVALHTVEPAIGVDEQHVLGDSPQVDDQIERDAAKKLILGYSLLRQQRLNW